MKYTEDRTSNPFVEFDEEEEEEEEERRRISSRG